MAGDEQLALSLHDYRIFLDREPIYNLLRLPHRVAAARPDQLTHNPRGARHHEQGVHAVGVEAAKVCDIAIVAEIEQQAHQRHGFLPNVSVYCARVLRRAQNSILFTRGNIGAEWRHGFAQQMQIDAQHDLGEPATLQLSGRPVVHREMLLDVEIFLDQLRAELGRYVPDRQRHFFLPSAFL